MSSDKKDASFDMYKDDPRIPCQYGEKCYRRNPQHHKEYKHPPKEEETISIKQETRKLITGTKRKSPRKNDESKPQRKLQKTDQSSEENLHTTSSNLESDIKNSNEDNKNSNVEMEASNNNGTAVQVSLNERDRLSNSIEHDAIANTLVSDIDAQRMITDLFLVKMPKDFYEFYDFCRSISKVNPALACKSVSLQLVGPYDVLCGKINSENNGYKEKYLTHWRYYYDPPEFQTIIKCDDKEGLHFGYWRDDATEKPVFVAKNRGNVDCIFESVAENIFGAVDAYLQNKTKLANPFQKTAIMRLHSQLKSFAKQHDITLGKNTTDMQLREKKVVARTFHRIGVVVPYDKKTQLGYRELAITDKDLQNRLKQIEEAGTPDERKMPIAKLDEVVRLATIAADECDFGTCLELGHDLFCSGSVHVQNKALQMLSIAYTHLQRPELLKIFKIHLKNRRKNNELSVI